MQSARAVGRAARPLADGERLIVRGQVQGVGFRPTVWRVASELGLTGTVRNTAEGVEITLWGEGHAHFANRLVDALPPLARIDTLERSAVSGTPPEAFTIAPSEAGAVRAAITPDVAVCDACVNEIANSSARRFAYPFTNCTDCGPRFSIQEAVPYDRHNTTMAGFVLCPHCQGEYDDPTDRRFHAEPIACPDCGPEASLEWLGADADRPAPDGSDPLAEAARLLRDGYIVAIKGLGGIHLACDATNAEAVQRLRTRKGREAKAFALMARDTDVIARHARLTAEEEALLSSPSAPIVLLEAWGADIPEAIAPGLKSLGFMLPYTPLHALLMASFDAPIVMTSGNRSGAPQVIDNDDARTRLAGVADAALLHNRPIARRIDDSVVRVDCGAPRVFRRARGFAPVPLPLPEGFDGATPVLAMGSELKNTFCLVKDGEAILSHHMGDLEDAATHQDAAHNLSLYADLFQHTPAVVAVDLHPDYLSTKRGVGLAGSRPVVAVQHHHAHIAACLAENARPANAPPVVGIVMDGLGLGPDDTVWGGEFLVADYRSFERAASLKPVLLPGGNAASREPWRNTYAHLCAAMGWPNAADHANVPAIARLADKPLATLDAMMARGLNAPLSSSCGRLFDAAAALCLICFDGQTYEGEAAMRFEAAIDHRALADPQEAYPFDIHAEGGRLCLNPAPLWPGLLDDLDAAAPIGLMAARFHRGLANAIVNAAARIALARGLDTIALSGGCFQNKALFSLVHDGLVSQNLSVLSHRQVPANDGGLSLGQAVVALAHVEGGLSCA